MFNNEYYDGGASNLREENLSLAALHTVVASVGGSVLETTHSADAWGVDATCCFKGRFTNDPAENPGKFLFVQLKSTRNPQTVLVGDEEFWSLPVKVASLRNYLAWDNFILVLLVLPPLEEQEHWVEVDAEQVRLRKGLYWKSLDGFAVDDSKETNVVHISKKALLTPEALVSFVTSTSLVKVNFYVRSYRLQ